MNSSPSCQIPRAFSAFGKITPEAEQKPARILDSLRQPQGLVDPFAPTPLGGLSAKRTAGLFLGGMATAVSGRWIWRGLRGNPPTKPLQFETNNIMKNDPNKKDEMNVLQSFSEALSAIYRLALADPSQRKALFAYVGSSILGYVAGSTAQGVQETWVRREETRIRANLIAQMQTAFRESIDNKQESDLTLKEEARRKIYDLLVQSGIPEARALVEDQPIVESAQVNRHYFYEPTHRTMQTQRFGHEPQSAETAQPNQTSSPNRWLEAGIFGLGAFAGLALQGFVRLFTAPAESATYKGQKVIFESLHAKDKEAWWINGVKNPRNLAIMGGFFAMSAAAKLGKLFIDGLREIEVTRVNAHTELEYQAYNWKQLDPSFHRIAEETAFNHAYQQLAKDLPILKASPSQLKERIQTILANVGRNSAPKYFPMTPPVGLVVARS